jgi:Ca2+-binding EF-hand superfamily protein
MLCGHPAFHPDPRYQRQITHLTYYPMTGESWRSISAEAKDLVAKILNKCPNSRISLRDILSHPWCGGAAPAAELGPEYLHRVKALALRQKLKRFFIDNDIENEHRIRRQRLEKIEDINITSTSHPNHHYDRDGDDGSNSDAAACLGSPTRDKLKLLKRALVQVISMQASVAYSDSGLISVRDVSLSNLKLSKGELDVTDFCEIMLSLELKHLASPEVFRIFDINQDGKIDIKEFLLTLLSYRASTVGGDTAAGTTADALGDEDAATLYFRFFDLDEDGSISRAELRAVIACLFHDGSPFHALVDDSFSAVALDVTAGSAARKGGSGDLVSSINVENLFDLIDNNPKDGRIDIDEFKVFYHTILLPSATVRSVQHLGSSRSISGAPLQAAAVSVAPEMAATATAEGLPPCGDGGNV